MLAANKRTSRHLPAAPVLNQKLDFNVRNTIIVRVQELAGNLAVQPVEDVKITISLTVTMAMKQSLTHVISSFHQRICAVTHLSSGFKTWTTETRQTGSRLAA